MPICNGKVYLFKNGEFWDNTFIYKINKQKNLVCIYVGDASLEEGVFYESINFCVVKKLPVVIICENNFYSVYTHLNDRQPKNRKLYKLVEALGVTSHKFSQNNPYKLFLNFKKDLFLINSSYSAVS